MVDHALLPSQEAIDGARYPRLYEKAKVAILECERLDECKTWADQSVALASYARQSEDKEMERSAMEIRFRALRRCGELIKKIEKSVGGKPFQEKYTGEGGHPSKTRKQAAEDAGLSAHQQRAAVQLANISQTEWDECMDGEEAPTMEKLKAKGKKKPKKSKKPKSVPLYQQLGYTIEEFQAGIQFRGQITEYHTFITGISEADVDLAIAGSSEDERASIRDLLSQVERTHKKMRSRI